MYTDNYRGLLKYVKKYRVRAYYDLDLEDFPRNEMGDIEASFEDMYIDCASNGQIRHTYRSEDGENIYAYYIDSIGKGHNVEKALRDAYPKMWLEIDECGSFDYFIYFKESDMDKVAKIVKAKTNGASIQPFSDKNLPKVVYSIPDKDEQAFQKIVAKLDSITKMHFIRKCCQDFDEVIQKKKGKKYNVEEERRKSRLKPKVFIHSIGMWDDFLKFAQTKYKEQY